jgi:hypothetical protein
MDSINKEQYIAGVIGGLTSLGLLMLYKRFACGNCKRGRGGRWGQPALIKGMQSTHLAAAIGPYSFGKMIESPNGQIYAWSSGQLGMTQDGNLA